jgi:cytochrome b subunit of formate dehydrogenase
MKTLNLMVASVFILTSSYTTALAQTDDEFCLACHGYEDLTGVDNKGNEISMYVSRATLDSSSHAFMSCVDCHADLSETEADHAEKVAPVNCSENCHEDVDEIYSSSAHGMAVDNPNAPTCVSCHGKHHILSHFEEGAATSKKNLPHTCSNCHHRQVLTDDPDVKIVDSFDRYMRGIHAEGIAKGIGSAASCDDCHGMHNLKKASDPNSMVNKMNIPNTCSKCHNDIFIQYGRGIHGKALAAGILDSPNCADCHGEHEILDIRNPRSPVNASNLSDYVCGRCHNDPAMVEKFGLGDDRFTSYQDSYHGLAIHGGSIKAATCASCHRAHDILPSANPASSIHPNNLTGTCQKCHVNANYAFASSYTHKTAYAQFNRLDSIVKWIYIVAIVLIIGAMMTHNLIIMARFLIEKSRYTKAQPMVQRFSGSMVYQHMVVTVAFIALVITGFALRYPDAWWVSILNFFGIFESARGVIHRVAAVLLLYISAHHALFLFLTRRGRFQFKALLPEKRDITDIFLNLKYHLGLTSEKPKFGFYDYTMKAEYWALVWGTFVMAFTGFVLWYPTFFTSFLPPWIVKISETIHLYEAWLATLAIAIFHFFFVMFHPEQYPMSFTWLTGKMTVSEVKHHHPAWWEQIKGEETVDESSESDAKPEQETVR